MVLRLFALLSLAALISSGVCEETCPDSELSDEAKLHKDILHCYSSDYRPVKDYKTTVQVKVRFAIKYLSFDAAEETFTVHSWVALIWKDEFLTWNPSNYGGITQIQVESHEIWTPRMAQYTADASIYQPDYIYTTCTVTSDGTVMCVPHIAHAGICQTTMRRWPYDIQNCTMIFGNWMHTGEQVNYSMFRNNPVHTEDYRDGPGWKLLKVVPERSQNQFANSSYPMLKYTYMMQREAAGPAAIVVVPSIAIVILTLTSLLLDFKDNVRLVLVCFSLFGHFTFLTEIGYEMPKHSSDSPIILLFIRDSMIITLVAILETLFLMSLRKRTEPAPSWVVSMTRLATSGPGKYVVFTEFDPADISDKKNLSEDPTSSLNENTARIASEWTQFAGLLNSFLFILSFFVYIVLIFLYIPYH